MIHLSKKTIWIYLQVALKLTVLFVLLYGFSNWFAEHSTNQYRFYFDFELAIPLIPSMIVIYTSLNVLNLTPMIFLKERQIRSLGTSMLWATILAFVVFMLFPAPAGFERVIPEGAWSHYFEVLYSLDKKANTLPSLHITYSYLVTRSVEFNLKKNWMWGWFFFICLSVVLTHQHHILDIFTGMILAEFCYRKFAELGND